jgi:hypothetical protein
MLLARALAITSFKPELVLRVVSALFNRHGNLAADFSEYLAAFGIRTLFFIFDVGPFGMS